MKLTNTHLNVTLYLVTLAAAAAHLVWNAHLTAPFLIPFVAILLFLLLLLAVRGFQQTFSSTLPIFAAFWSILYVTLPVADTLQTGTLVQNLSRCLSYLLPVLPLLLVALVALVLLHKFSKDSHHFILVILRYLALGVILALISMALIYTILPVETEIYRAALLGPLFFGGVCLCMELASSLGDTYRSYRSHFVWLTLCFSLMPLVVGPTALWSVEQILMGQNYRLPCAVAVILLGVLSLSLKTSIDDWNTPLKGYQNQILACFFFLWSAYSLLTMVWNQFFHQAVFFFGAPLAYLLYVFLRRYHGKWLPMMQKSGNQFLAAYTLSALVLLLALGRTIALRPEYLVLVAVLLVVRYICTALADKGQKPLVLHCFQGVASLLLLTAARVSLSFSALSPFLLASLLVIAAFWCVLCFFLFHATPDTTRVYPNEYAFANKIRGWIPAALSVLSLLLLLFR